ncbi:aminotransferase class IV [Lutispora thermophila]|uniref:Branched-chain amino acid aminotransferase n=1 Tax=Lutispora thermophila DSM 19022 TaxID=1122184 RepID=A0A1M6DAH4_9FIRM|nr:aminotransferase class IV [Lutispora thermophila]SHI70048.1 branched-chain amino acid aminotransferase [Lutispora thermophila DSM 19022]
MNNEAIEKYSIHNGDIINNESQAVYENSHYKIVYEVIRVIDGIPLFLEDHMSRLLKSSEMIDINISHLIDKIQSDIKKVILINHSPLKNLKIIVYKDYNNTINYSIFFIKSSYPNPDLYVTGINTILFKALRENPNAKVQNSQLREKINKELLKNDAYEALLVNEQGYITEGSKSNVFFTKDKTLYTSQKQDVLLGVTRTHVIELANELGIKVIEEPIHKSFLNLCDGLFITGTSPKVLPVCKVDDMTFNSSKDETIQKLMKAYDLRIKEYVNSYKS